MVRGLPTHARPHRRGGTAGSAVGVGDRAPRLRRWLPSAAADVRGRRRGPYRPVADRHRDRDRAADAPAGAGRAGRARRRGQRRAAGVGAGRRLPRGRVRGLRRRSRPSLSDARGGRRAAAQPVGVRRGDTAAGAAAATDLDRGSWTALRPHRRAVGRRPAVARPGAVDDLSRDPGRGGARSGIGPCRRPGQPVSGRRSRGRARGNPRTGSPQPSHLWAGRQRRRRAVAASPGALPRRRGSPDRGRDCRDAGDRHLLL